MGYRTNVTTTPSALAAADAASGRSWCYAYDGNGNVSAVVDLADGTKVGRYEYDAFGRTIASWGDEGLAEVNEYRYSTKPLEGTGLYYYVGDGVMQHFLTLTTSHYHPPALDPLRLERTAAFH
jgi:YD repeat-containing protein